MSIQTAIVAKLKATTTVTDLIGSRVYPVSPPHGVTLPYVVYQIISDVPVNHSTGEDDTHNARVQIDCVDDTYSVAWSVAGAIQTALAGWSDSDLKIGSCLMISKQDLPKPPDDGGEIYLQAVTMDFSVWSTA